MSNGSEPSAFQRLSAPLLMRLAALPRWLFVVGPAVLVFLGLLLPGWPGAIVLLLLAGFLTWLAALGWQRLAPFPRLLRVATVVLVLAAAVAKVT